MTDSIKPSIHENPSHFILYVGKNNLNYNDSAKCIAESVVEKSMVLQSDKHDVTTFPKNEHFLPLDMHTNVRIKR